MSHDPDAQPPFTLWVETLATGDKGTVLIWRRGEQVYAVFYWNLAFHSERAFTSRSAAEAWGYELHRVMQEDLLAGVLLGYDLEVLERLQSLCSA